MNLLSDSYFIKLNLLLLVVAAVYFFSLNKVNQPVIKRWFLLFGSVSVFIVPFLSIPTPVDGALATIVLPELNVGQVFTQTNPSFSIELMAKWLYVIISGVLIIKLLYGLYELSQKRKRATFTLIDGVPTLVNPEFKSAFSFGNRVYAPYLPLDEETLKHESIHIQQLHSLDKLWFELLVCLCWFNPAVFLFRKWAEENHEFEVDQLLLKDGVDADKYSRLLIEHALDQNGIRVTNTFSQFKILKTRINMMKTTSSKNARWRWLFAVPAVAMTIAAVQACDKSKLEGTVKEIAAVPDQPAKFKGGDEAMINWLGENIVYPEAAKAKGQQGTVYVTFLVHPDGDINHPQIVKSENPLLSSAAIAAIEAMPDWEPAVKNGKPVESQYTLPVKFALE